MVAAWWQRWRSGGTGSEAALQRAVAACAVAQRAAEAAALRAVNAALVAEEAARRRGVGDGRAGGVDSDLETLDPRT